MGLIHSKLKRKLTTLEQLKLIEDSLRKIEDYKKSTERAQKKTIANVIIYGAASYVMACVVIFVWYLPESWITTVVLFVPLVLVPFIIYWTKIQISRYFNSKIVKANVEYAELQKKKKYIIENVMETETFNKAKEILSMYAPEKLGKTEEQEMKLPQSVSLKNINADLRKRKNALPTATHMSTALKPALPPSNSLKRNDDLKLLPQRGLDFTLPKLRQSMPWPVLHKDRSFTDKLVEYIIGDGPSNRYALICKFCHGHNGMALKEEFLYMAFNCCYCMTFNAARLRRPLAPKLPEPPMIKGAEPPFPSNGSKTSNTQPQTFLKQEFGTSNSQVEENSSAEESKPRSISGCVEPLRGPERNDDETSPSEHQASYFIPVENQQVFKHFNDIINSIKGEWETEENETQRSNADIFAPEEYLIGEKIENPNTNEEMQRNG